MKNLSKFEKLFTASNFLLWTSGYVFDVLLSFFIWQRNNDFQAVLYYNLGYAIGIFFGAAIAVYLLQYLLSPKIRALAIALAATFAFVILKVEANSYEVLFGLGLYYGLAVGLRAIPYNIIFQVQIKSENRMVFKSVNDMLYNSMLLVFPLFLTQLIDRSGSYTFAFILAFIINILAVVPMYLSVRYANAEKKLKLDFQGTFREIRHSNNLKWLLVMDFLNGVTSGFKIAVLGVLGLYLLDDVGNWGIVNAVITILAIVLNYLIAKKVNFKKAPVLFNLFGLIYSVLTLLFAIYFNIVWYIIFLVIGTFKTVLFGSSYSNIDSKIKDRRIEEGSHLDEFTMIQEFPLFIGRLIPIGFLILTGADLGESVTLNALLLIVAVLPMLMSFALDQISLVKRKDDPFIYS